MRKIKNIVMIILTNNTIVNNDAEGNIKLTGDSYVTSLECEDETYSNIDFNGFTLYVNGAAVN